MQESKSLPELLLEQLEQKNLTTTKLSEITGIPERFINIFLDPEYSNLHALPSAPYVRGYLKKISLALELNPETIWQIYENRNAPQQSGPKDRLPQNRFAIQPLNKKNVLLIICSSLFLLYIIFNASRLLNKPSISITEPAGEVTTLATPSFYIKGSVENHKDILTVNGAPVFINEAGEFNKEFSLTPGTNTFEIILKRFLGRETQLTRQVIYAPAKLILESTKPSL